MKRIILIMHFLISIAYSQNFIGYRDGLGVFCDENLKRFITFDEKVIDDINFIDGLEPLFINDNILLLFDADSNILKKYSKCAIDEVLVKERPYFITSDCTGNFIVFNDSGDNLKVINSNSEIYDTKIEGFSPMIIKDTLYFSKYMEENNHTGVQVDIYKSKFDNKDQLGKITKIFTNLVHDGQYISDDGNYIIGSRFIDGQLKDIIYDLFNKKLHLFKTNYLSTGYMPYYSLQEKKYFIYTIGDFNRQEIKIEDTKIKY